ncbi:hypothetical protein BDQ17DRAFT_1351511 [Cyathus striatus]|nr:hypothetical protein BDQ17DRAFT_1351511 [Cyathus striatus]
MSQNSNTSAVVPADTVLPPYPSATISYANLIEPQFYARVYTALKLPHLSYVPLVLDAMGPQALYARQIFEEREHRMANLSESTPTDDGLPPYPNATINYTNLTEPQFYARVRTAFRFPDVTLVPQFIEAMGAQAPYARQRLEEHEHQEALRSENAMLLVCTASYALRLFK